MSLFETAIILHTAVLIYGSAIKTQNTENVDVSEINLNSFINYLMKDSLLPTNERDVFGDEIQADFHSRQKRGKDSWFDEENTESSGDEEGWVPIFPTIPVNAVDPPVGNKPEKENSTETDSTSNERENETGQKPESNEIEEGGSTTQLNEIQSGQSRSAEAPWGIIAIAVVTIAVIFFFIGFFIFRQCRKSKPGDEYQIVLRQNHMQVNGAEMQRFSAVDNDVTDDVTVPLNSVDDINQDKTTSFKQEPGNSRIPFVAHKHQSMQLTIPKSTKQITVNLIKFKKSDKQDFEENEQRSPVNIETDKVEEDGSLLNNPLQINYAKGPQEHSITNIELDKLDQSDHESDLSDIEDGIV